MSNIRRAPPEIEGGILKVFIGSERLRAQDLGIRPSEVDGWIALRKFHPEARATEMVFAAREATP